MKYEVWHDKNPSFGFGGKTCKFPKDYEHVANVEARSLDHAFELTNHIDDGWQKNKGVETLADQARSTSVGDIIVDPENKKWRCDMIGWTQLEE